VSIALIALRQMVRDRIGVPPHDEFFKDTVLDTNINLAYAAIEGESRWPWAERYETLTVGVDGEFDAPLNWRATRALTVDHSDLIEMTPYDMMIRFGDSAARPTHYSVVNGRFKVRPTPMSDIEMNHLYYVLPTLLAVDADAPSIPLEHIGTLIAKAAQLCSVREDDRPSADSHLAEYLQGLQRMRKDVRGTTRPTRIRVRPGGWLGD